MTNPKLIFVGVKNMAFERYSDDLESMRLEARLKSASDADSNPSVIQSVDWSAHQDGVARRHRVEAESLGFRTGTSSDQESIASLRQLLEHTRAGRDGMRLEDYNNKMHMHQVLERGNRPKKGARYMAPRCRVTPDGAGGAPLSRPSSAPIGGRGRVSKTERWREAGLQRWPKEFDKVQQMSDPSDGDPLRRKGSEQPTWCQELWIRSLRRPGLEIQDLVYDDAGQRGVRELHEEWTRMRPVSARSIQETVVPYSGSTSRAHAAMPQKKNARAWVERPVSTGKVSLQHMGGKRYAFNKEPRYLEWNEYLQLVNQIRD